MAYVAIDLGSTNIKAALYDNKLKKVAIRSSKVAYDRKGKHIEFDADEYFNLVVSLLKELGKTDLEVHSIVLTGQAESLVLLGKDGKPLRKAISWMDERSEEECRELSEIFDQEICYAVTGQKNIIPTWPATKILHLSKHEPDTIARTSFFVMIKDYIAFRLTGKLVSDKSIATFTFYFNIHTEKYWDAMLKACNIAPEQLPPLADPGTVLGIVTHDLSREPAYRNTLLNIGTLDHFAGMIGTGNIHPGTVSESTGTVLGIAAMAKLPLTGKETATLHYGPFPGSYVFMQVAESGGVCLEWFRSRFMKNLSFKDIDDLAAERGCPNSMIFLPYIVGVNAPEFNEHARGVFYGIHAEHDAVDFACAVMEGVAILLDRNIAEMRKNGIAFDRIISTGGGAKSDLWSQMKADITGLTVEIPADNEAACLGAVIMGAVNDGLFSSYKEAVESAVTIRKKFRPRSIETYSVKKAGFNVLYRALFEQDDT